MNSTCLLLSVCLSLPLVPSTGWCMQTFDFTALTQKIQEETKKTPTNPLEKTDAWVASQQEDGSWDDFEYGTLTFSGANRHLWRLLEIAKVFTSAKQLKYYAAVYKRSIKKGLHFWEKSKTKDPNWWHNEINWPKQLGELLLLVQEFKEYLEVGKNAISQETLLNLFHPTTIKALSSHGNGANMFDYGLHYIYRAVLTEDLNLLCKTSEVLEKNIVQQLQPDLSFYEHGPQLHLASYGSVFQSAVVKIAYNLSDTPAAFDINSKPFSHFLVFVRTVLIPSIRGQYWDFNILGRSISSPNATKGKIAHLNVLSETIDPENHKTYKQALQRIRGMVPASFGIKKANVHYWNSDYTQHRRRGFLFSIRNVSTTTVAYETGNNENLKGHYLSYGANFLAQKGDEYFNLMPA